MKDHIPDQWDYFDVKGVVPQNASQLDSVFGDSGCKMPTG